MSNRNQHHNSDGEATRTEVASAVNKIKTKAVREIENYRDRLEVLEGSHRRDAELLAEARHQARLAKGLAIGGLAVGAAGLALGVGIVVVSGRS